MFPPFDAVLKTVGWMDHDLENTSQMYLKFAPTLNQCFDARGNASIRCSGGMFLPLLSL